MFHASDAIAGYAWVGAQVALVAAIGIYTFRKRMLDLSGALVAFGMGAAIVVATNIFWLFLLFSLLGLASVATRFNFKEKQARKVAEKHQGQRRSRNVLANGLTPTLMAVLAPVLLGVWGPFVAAMGFVSAIAAAASDTMASEFGSLSKRVFLITTFKPVPPGTDGGVSAAGQAAAFGGALAIALLSIPFLGLLTPDPLRMPLGPGVLLIPTIAGFLGCQVDSILGATLEGGGLLNKEEVNFLGISSGALAGLALALAFGPGTA